MMDDFISRQAAINTIDFMCKACEGSLNDFRDLLIEGFINLPSAQPTQTNTPNALKALDCVSRQAVRMIESSPDAYPEEWNDDYEKGFTDAVKSALSLPSAQPEIIRCKDCKHWYDAPAIDEYNSCELDALIRHKDFYCANAERRTDG